MTPSPKPDDARQRILDAASVVFAANGRHAARIRDIADRADVAYGLVYHYFGTKDRLLQTLFDENWALFADAVEGITTSERSLQEQLHAIVEYVLGALEAYPDRVRVIIVEYARDQAVGEAMRRPEAERALRAIRTILERAEHNGILTDGVDPDALLPLLVGILEAAVVRGTSGTPNPNIRPTVHAVIRGIIRP